MGGQWESIQSIKKRHSCHSKFGLMNPNPNPPSTRSTTNYLYSTTVEGYKGQDQDSEEEYHGGGAGAAVVI